uniref:fructose bisphosphate aldolase n=1 Tax=Altererythrobacter segetis TaxID=1104773 RepID=UPI0014097B7F|nr:fructose bisphosphate aldolase [Altererythrobacter segetis]
MMDRIRRAKGIIAAIDQSGGSTPKTLIRYGLSPDAWTGEEEMFDLIHRMRCRILLSPAFDGQKVLAAILFERTMKGVAGGKPVPQLLHDKGIVPFVKIDQGLEAEADRVQLMKPIPDLPRKLAQARELGMLGTKARSLIKGADPKGIAAIVRQQFEIGKAVLDADLLPILEPEYDIYAPDRAEGEAILRSELLKGLSGLPEGRQIVLKLSIPVEPNACLELMRHARVARVAGLSGGYSRSEACAELAKNPGMIASFSRALMSDLRANMSEQQFDESLATAIDEIYRASTDPTVPFAAVSSSS